MSIVFIRKKKLYKYENDDDDDDDVEKGFFSFHSVQLVKICFRTQKFFFCFSIHHHQLQ